MSLSEANLLQVAKQQYFYKFKAYSNLLSNLLLLQILTLIITQGGSGGAGTAVNAASIQVYHHSSDFVIIVTIVWAMISAITCTTQTYKDMDFAYVSNRLSSDISSMGFLLTAGIVGGVMASLSGILIRVMLFFTMGSSNIAREYFFVPPQDLLTSILATILYIILAISIGYFVGTLAQISKAFIVLLPLVVVIAVRLSAGVLIEAFIKESSLLLFALKVLATSAILFYTSLQLSNRLEVRR